MEEAGARKKAAAEATSEGSANRPSGMRASMGAALAASPHAIRPIAVIYHVDAVLLAAWCELRNGLRHFRTDRIHACEATGATFRGQGAVFRQIWSEQNRWDVVSDMATRAGTS